MDNKSSDNQISNTNIKSAQIEKKDVNYESDSQTINNFDDEYGEVIQMRNINNKDLIKHNSNKTPKYRNSSYNKMLVNKSLKNLLEIDTSNKQEVLNILLDKHLIQKNSPDQTSKIKEINRNKFYYVESKTKPNLITKPQNTYGRKGFLLEIDKSNPEFIKDMNYAKFKLKKRIQKENEKVAKLLFANPSQTPHPHQSMSLIDIGKKIQSALDKKRKSIQRIELQLYEQEKLEHTFSPSIKHLKKYGSKRNFEIFLRDQNEFQKKVKMKNKNNLMKSQSEKQLLFVGHPIINKKSEKIVKKLDVEKDVYERLYKRNTYNINKNNNHFNYFEYAYKMNNTSNNSITKKNRYSYVRSKINVWKKDYKTNNNRNDSHKKLLSNKARSTSDLFIDKRLFSSKDLSTNKMLWNKFNKKFDKIIENININKSNKMNGSNVDIKNADEIDENQYYEILYNLGIINCSREINMEKQNESKNNSINTKLNKTYKTEIIDINGLNNEEKKIVLNSFNILKLGNSKIKIYNLKEFLIFVFNLHKYHFYHQYKASHSEEEIQKLFPLDKYKIDEIPLILIKQYNKELLNHIDKSNSNNTKYFYIDKNNKNKIIITLDNYHQIKKDFSLFNLNYLNYKKEKSPKKIIELNNVSFQKNNSPKIKDKLNYTMKRKTSNRTQNKINMQYFERILLQEKRRIAKNEKRKEELTNKQIQECTFKPKINTTKPSYINHKKNDAKKNQNIQTEKNKENKKFSRTEEMYQKGKRTLKNRKNREIYEIELEEQINECTFKPHVYPNTANKTNKSNKINIDIYNERQYRSLYERMKKGRLNQLVKNSNNDRYELSEELKKYVKECQEENSLSNQTYPYRADSCYYYHNNDMYINDEHNTEDNMIKNCNLYVNINNNDKKSNNKDEKDINSKNDKNKKIMKFEKKQKEKNKSEYNLDKKDPLFIIDINITDKLKKQIYVYEGDSAKNLAMEFAKEYNLNSETQSKLENLIQNQMEKPLTKIDEENVTEQDKI